MPDLGTLQYIGAIGGIGAVFGFVILGAAILFLRDLSKIWREEFEYRRQRDAAMITAIETNTATLAKVIERVDRLSDVDRILELLQQGRQDEGKRQTRTSPRVQ